MEERIRRTVRNLQVWYALVWVLPLLMGIGTETGMSWTGLYAGDVRATYVIETGAILLVVICVPLALKLFAWVLARQIDRAGVERALRLYAVWSMVRMGLLFVPAMTGFVGYALALSDKCLLCALIALVALLFCVPGEKRLRNELHIDRQSEE